MEETIKTRENEPAVGAGCDGLAVNGHAPTARRPGFGYVLPDVVDEMSLDLRHGHCAAATVRQLAGSLGDEEPRERHY